MVKRHYFLISLLTGALVGLSFYAGLWSGLELFFEDLLFFPKPFRDEIVILAIDNESIAHLGQWPWPRQTFAEILQTLAEYPPAALGIDVIFSENSRLGENDDEKLAAVLAATPYPVVLPVTTIQNQLVKPLPIFAAASAVRLGHVNLIIDRDGVVRFFYPETEAYPSFAHALLNIYNQLLPKNSLAKTKSRIVYAQPAGSVKRIPLQRILDKDDPIKQTLKNKLVLIGATSPDLHDEQLTPFSRGTPMAGIEIQANILNMILQNYELRSLPNFFTLLWILIASVLASLSFLFLSHIVKPLIFNFALGLISLTLIIVLFDNGWAANFLHLNFAWILSSLTAFGYKYFVAEKERRHIKNIFSKYVATDVLAHILQNPSAVKLGGEEREITILFSDIRDFTSLSEKTTPTALVSILNKYFSAMTREIIKNKGVLDKYIGDAIMAFWGAPLADESQADNALLAATGMANALKQLNAELVKQGTPAIKIGIGICTGRAVVGNVGSELRFDYTAIGDTVNVASRLEGLNKTYHTKIIISESTKEKIKNNYHFEFLGETAVKGRQEPIKIYTLV